jgi:hypothetical protein
MSLFPFSLCCARYFNLNGTNLPISFDRFLGLIGLLRVIKSKEHFCLSIRHLATAIGLKCWRRGYNFGRINHSRQIYGVAAEH